MTPSSSIFRGVYALCESIGYTTDYIDETSDGKNLPLIYIGESSSSKGENKDVVGTATQTIHVYGKRTQRDELDTIVGRLQYGLVNDMLEFDYSLTSPRTTVRTIQDKSMGQVLTHHIVEYRAVYARVYVPTEPEVPVPVVATIDPIKEGDLVISGTGTPREKVLIVISGGLLVTNTVSIGEDGTYRYAQGYTIKGGDVVKVLRLANGSELATYTVPEEGTGGDEDEDTPEEDFEYKVYGMNITIVGYIGKSQHVRVPEYIEGKVVTGIGSDAFSSKALLSLKLPDGVRSIGSSAFQYNSLTEVNFPKNMGSTINVSVYRYNSITKLEIPEGVTVINSDAFQNNAISRLVLPNSLVDIYDRVFRSNALTEIVIPNGVKRIGSQSFANNHLERVVIPPSVISIGSGAFDNDVEIIHEDSPVLARMMSMAVVAEEVADNSGIVIQGYRGTEAERYALKNGHTFEELDIEKI